MVHSLAAAMVAVSTFAVTSSQVEWQADYGKALAATRSDQRPLLIVLDIPSNPQASLDRNLLTAEGDQAQLLQSYELCHVDVSTPYGQKVAQAFGATQFPHTAIIDRTGAVVIFKKPGQMALGEWSATLAKYQGGERPVPASQTAYFRGGSIMPTSYPTMSNRSYCPSCQRAAMGM
jgi:hypothetical protein